MTKMLDKLQMAERVGVGVPYLMRLTTELGILPAQGWKDTPKGRRPVTLFRLTDLGAFRARIKVKRESRLAKCIQGRKASLKRRDDGVPKSKTAGAMAEVHLRGAGQGR